MLIYVNVHANRMVLEEYDDKIILWTVRIVCGTQSLCLNMCIAIIGGMPGQYDVMTGFPGPNNIVHTFDLCIGLYLIIINLLVKALTFKAALSFAHGLDVQISRKSKKSWR